MAQPATDEAGLYEGLLLGGKYRLEAEIGRGAMGTVWAAIHKTLGQRVAVKVISQEHASSDELRHRFDTEARAAAKLRSRFVVGVYDNGITDQGLPYIVMEYLEGECLEDRIAREGSISVADAARISRHVARGLSKAHAHNIVHRDLKPANIFITKSDDEDDGDDWTAKVLDFGIAKMDDFGDRSTTKTGTVLGTPLFMSPEQVRGASNVDARADLYSMGMVVYNMLTGTYAFDGQSFGDLLVSICTDPLPEMSRSAPHAPPALNTWFKKACARDPNDRYQTADDLMNGLTEAIGDTAPVTRLSVSDISSADRLIPLAETFVARSEVAESGSRQVGPHSVDPGGSVHTVVEPPKKKSSFPYLVAGAALLGLGALALAMSGGNEESPSTGAAQPIPAELPQKNAASAEHADVVNLDAAEATPGDPPSAEKVEEGAPPDAEEVKPVEEKPPAAKTNPVVAPQPVVAPAPRAKAPAPEPTPAPKPSGPSVPDLGF